jgi:hypothetical protein
MTAAGFPVPSRPLRAGRLPLRLPGRLLRLELRRNAMLWMLPLLAVMFWLDTYHRIEALPAFWSLRIPVIQQHVVQDFAPFVAGAAAWMGSRDGRRHTTDLVAVTALARWAGQLATWAATTFWALVAYFGCAAAVFWVTARQASWGGPLWWPVAVGAAAEAALCALGFTAGALLPSRFTAPLAAAGALLVLLATGHMLISPISQQNTLIAPDWGIFYPFFPDLSIAQLMFLAGLAAAALGVLGLPAAAGGRFVRRGAAAVTTVGVLAAVTAFGLARTAEYAAHGLVIPALHDAASDRPVSYTPACSRAAVPICLQPAYRAYLPAVTAALEPVLRQVAGLLGAPVRVTQIALTLLAHTGNSTATGGNPVISGSPPVLRLALGDLPGDQDGTTTASFIAQLKSSVAPEIAGNVIDAGQGPQDRPAPGALPGDLAQQAITAALLKAAGLQMTGPPGFGVQSGYAMPGPAPGSPAYAAARRFAALPAAARHGWLAVHLTALRAGRITLAQLP